MPIKHILGAVGTLGLLTISTAAQAGHCGGQYMSPQCNVPVHHIPGPAPQFDAMTVTSVNPMGHLRSIDFQRSPHVSIMRVHGIGQTANLSDAPIGFTGGCHSQSTSYCRQATVAPVMPQVIRPTAPRFGQGYDPSKFTSRQYGENTFTPGIAHIPTSIVDRSPINADRALNSGRAVPQAIANGGIAPRPSMITRQAPRAPMSYGQNIGSNGGYWEKVSGPTMIGNTMATQVICRRAAPARVVRPVIGVPTPVPTPVPVHAGCASHNSVHGHSAPSAPDGNPVQGNPYAGWTY